MCGIVGYFGKQQPKNVLLQGLKKLEYRGYDSSGVAIYNEGSFEVFRAEGKLSALETKISDVQFQGSVGIGHTRWATHGVPSEANAHPHKVDGVTLVHNGIIENYLDLKADLTKAGVAFQSQTDSEVVAHILAKELKDTNDLMLAVQNTIPQLQGAFAILAVSEAEPDTIVAFKSGPPLLIGVGKGEILLASDVQALIDHTNQVVYLEDYEIVKVVGDTYQIYSTTGQKLEKEIHTLDVKAENSDKKGYKHYMLKEIFEQPRAVASALHPYIDVEKNVVNFENLGPNQTETSPEAMARLKEVERIYIVACGTSFYSGMYAEYLLEKLAKVPVEIDIASEFRYRDPVIEKNSLVLVISQSGETADTLAALRLMKEQGVLTASICNTKQSTIDRECDLHFYMNSGAEIGVASTKAFVSTLAVLNTFAIYMAKSRQAITAQEESEHVEALLALPSLMETVLAYDKFFGEAAEKTLKRFRGFLYLGRGLSYPIAMEGALKLKELAYMHAEGYAAGEMKHGPLALIDGHMATVVICPKDTYYEKTVSNLEEAKARGAVIISIGTGNDKHLKGLSEHYLSLPETSWTTSGILSVIPVQLLSYHLADALGHDVDQPRNLAKSVTVE